MSWCRMVSRNEISRQYQPQLLGPNDSPTSTARKKPQRQGNALHCCLGAVTWGARRYCTVQIDRSTTYIKVSITKYEQKKREILCAFLLLSVEELHLAVLWCIDTCPILVIPSTTYVLARRYMYTVHCISCDHQHVHVRICPPHLNLLTAKDCADGTCACRGIVYTCSDFHILPVAKLQL